MWPTASDNNKDLHISDFGYSVQMDRSPLIKNKAWGGGVCFCIDERYCNNVTVWGGNIHPRSWAAIHLISATLPAKRVSLDFLHHHLHKPTGQLSAATQLKTQLYLTWHYEIYVRRFESMPDTQIFKDVWTIHHLHLITAVFCWCQTTKHL